MDTGSQTPHGSQPIFDVPPRRSGTHTQKNVWAIVGVLGIIAVIVIGWIIFSRFSGSDSAEPSPTPNAFPAFTEPSPTPAAEEENVDKADITIEVLNGTGIAKEASFLQNKLGSLDYTKIETGNADAKTYDTARVTFYATFPQSLRSELQDLLEDLYTDVEVDDVSKESDVDVRIITGLRPGVERPTPAPESDDESTDEEASESASIEQNAS